MDKICKYCNVKPGIKYSKYSSGDFCSKKCANGYSTLNKRKNINIKVSKTLTGRKWALLIEKTCPTCELSFFVKKTKRDQIYCSVKCTKSSVEYRNKLSFIGSKRCSSINEKMRLREIGRMGGFGKKGYTSNGTYYQSNFEKKVFEFLEVSNIEYVPHKNIPNSSKISDVYLSDLNLWIELDGIDREKKKKWIGKDYEYWIEKLEIYKNQNLPLMIFKTYDEFIKYIVP
jgi:hypothetical protein